MRMKIERDSELAAAEWQVRVADAELLTSLAEALDAVRTAAAQATDKQLQRWQEHSQKLWHAQKVIAQRHGVTFESGMKTGALIRRQLRQTWLGNIVGIVTPLALFGFSLFEHGLLLPLFWAAAVSADVAGHVTCIKVAYVSRSYMDKAFLVEPIDAAAKVKNAIDNARVTNEWANTQVAMTELTELDKIILEGDNSLRQARRSGYISAGVSMAVLVIFAIAVQQRLVPDAVLPWVVMTVTIALVYGAGVWLTSVTYADAVEQPPYPSRGSAGELQINVGLEIALRTMGAGLLNDSQTIRERIPPKMLLGSDMHQRMRQLERCETALNDAQWQVAIIKAERGQSARAMEAES